MPTLFKGQLYLCVLTVCLPIISSLTYKLLEGNSMSRHSCILNTQLCLWHRDDTYLTDEQKFETGLWESYKEGKLEQWEQLQSFKCLIHSPQGTCESRNATRMFLCVHLFSWERESIVYSISSEETNTPERTSNTDSIYLWLIPALRKTCSLWILWKHIGILQQGVSVEQSTMLLSAFIHFLER